MGDIRVKVKEFLSRFFRKYELKDDDDIFELGFVNSLFAMQLVMFLEKEFNIKMDNKDIDQNNFKSINNIVKLVENKIA